MTDHDLLQQFFRDRSNSAFAELVRRHMDWLYSTALRQMRDPAPAQDVTQAVFLVLAKKAPTLPAATPLGPWLFRVLNYVAANARRAEIRRKHHESEAAIMRAEILSTSEAADWSELAPLLDHAVERLPSADRAAILLRFYQQMSLAQVGAAMGISEEAARKRVARAITRLRDRLSSVNPHAGLSSGVLGSILLQNTTHAAPAMLTSTAISISAVSATSAATSLAQGALTMMFHAQIKWIAACAASLLIAGAVSAAVVHAALAQSAAPSAPLAAAATPAPPVPFGQSAPPTSPEADRRAAIAAGAGRAGPTTAQAQAALDAREKFLAIERFARLSADQQAKDLLHFYKDLAVVGMNRGLLALSSIPENILQRRSLGNPSGNSNERWNRQLQEAAATMTPEQVADALADTSTMNTWLSIGSTVRTEYVLAQNRKGLIVLVSADLDSTDVPTFRRGTSTVYSMGLKECTEKLISVYLKADAESEAAHGETPLLKEARISLIFMRDPAIVGLLMPIVEKDPKTLIRHSVLLDGPLMTMPAEPLLLKLLESPDVDIREAATHALGDCKDPALAKPISKLAQDPDPRLHPQALFLAEHIPDEAFALARPELLQFLSAPDEQLRINAITTFSVHKDPAAGPPLLAFLKQEKMDRVHSNVLVIAVGKLTGGAIRYNQFEWGPTGRDNGRAIADLEAWIVQHPAK